ncbi:MAG: DUF4179 domain-containing protein [Lachnospiraceae bacterium]|nr:DUF4179 domain-containing protein [Lachnospiraceae bacterium]
MNHYTEQELRKTLGGELPISNTVNQRLEQTCQSIRSQTPRKNRRPVVWRNSAAVAAVLAGGIFCMGNPSLAAKLPLIGHLFEELGDVSGFPGDYSGVGTPLTEDTEADSAMADSSDGSTEDTAESDRIIESQAAAPSYTQSSDGITMTLSEVYCNEAALYLTLELVSEEPFENYYAEENGAPVLALEGTMDFSFNEEAQALSEYLDGKLVDENTYIGLLRIDLQYVQKDYTAFHEAVESADLAYDSDSYDLYGDLIGEIELPEEFEIKITVDQIIGDLEEPVSIYEAAGVEEPDEEELAAMSDEEWASWWQELYDLVPDYQLYPNAYQNYWYDGSFTFDVDVTVDSEQSVTVTVDEDSDESYYVKAVTVTPFELYVSEVGNLSSADRVLVVLDADGRKLAYGSNGGAMNVFQTDGYDLTTIDLYSVSWNDWDVRGIKSTYFDGHETNEAGQTLREVLEEICLYHRTVTFEGQ